MISIIIRNNDIYAGKLRETAPSVQGFKYIVRNMPLKYMKVTVRICMKQKNAGKNT